MEYDLSPKTVILIISLTISAYLVDQCITPPNPAPSANIEYGSDSMKIIHRLEKIRPWATVLWILHFVLMIFPKNRADLCLNPDVLNEDMYRWSNTTVIYIIAVFICATSRMIAYAQLGKNFTYRLATPSGLIKSGFYAYVQHPSYTALLGIAVINACSMLAPDGTIACILPRVIAGPTLKPLFAFIMTAAAVTGIYFRVRDEETMMRKEFGAEWEEWNKKTKKFIPFIF